MTCNQIVKRFFMVIKKAELPPFLFNLYLYSDSIEVQVCEESDLGGYIAGVLGEDLWSEGIHNEKELSAFILVVSEYNEKFKEHYEL